MTVGPIVMQTLIALVRIKDENIISQELMSRHCVGMQQLKLIISSVECCAQQGCEVVGYSKFMQIYAKYMQISHYVCKYAKMC